MKWTRNFFTAALLVLGCAALFHPAAAQNADDDASASAVARFNVATNLVKVPISVFDERGLMTDRLRKEDFRLWEDQAQQEIRSLDLDTSSISVLLLLDTSPSSKSELEKIKSAARNFVDKLGRDDRVSIITFDENVNLILDWAGKSKAKDALGRRGGIQTGLRTALYDAMYLAAVEQMRGIDEPKAIILLTDCVNNHSRVNFEEAALAIAQSRASFYLISKTTMVKEQARQVRRVAIIEDIYREMFGEEMNSVNGFFDRREKEMTDLASITGGRVFFPANYDSIRNVYAEIARELKHKYYLTYVSNQELIPDSWRRIAVEYLSPASEVLYRRGYYYLPQTTRRVLAPAFARPR
ncbi:MAG: VWA domain-containing protein [Acidobacteriota bacterium]|nr:VWA domain-containing protein [Acidobacteriota bacterium]